MKTEGSTSLDAGRKDAPFNLFGLPQELFDVILAFAYSRSDETRPIPKFAWELRESLRHEAPELRQPFPARAVTKLMVSKAFFARAAQSYIESAPVYVGWAAESDHPNSILRVVGAFAKECVADLADLLTFPPMPKMRKLRLVIDERDVE